jgi:cellobiose phosphorylase
LHLRSNLLIDAGLGKLETQLKDLEEDYIKSISNIGNLPKVINNLGETKNEGRNEDLSNLKYYNEYGGFSEDRLEYLIKVNKNNKLPTVWSMILTNEKFGTLVTQNLGGFTWHENSRLNRLSAWNNNPGFDIPSEIIYLRDEETGELWSLSENINNHAQDYYITYGFGYVKEKTLSNNLWQELEIFVPREDSVKINILKLKNTISNRRKIKLVYYVKPVLRRR